MQSVNTIKANATFRHSIQLLKKSNYVYNFCYGQLYFQFNYLNVGGNDNIRPTIKSVLFMESVVVVLYDPELLSWYSVSGINAAGNSFLIISSFLHGELLAFV